MARLLNASVVFIILDNNPGLYSSDFMTKFNIFPEAYKPEPVILIPPLSHIRFGENYVFEALDNRVKFEIDFVSTMTESDDILTEVSMNFLTALDKNIFDSIGINYRLASDSCSLQNFSKNLPNHALMNNLGYSLALETLMVNVSLTQGFNNETPIVVSDFNFDGRAQEQQSQQDRIRLMKSFIEQRSTFLEEARRLLHESNL